MTIGQFQATRWTVGMNGQYDGKIYRIVEVDFGESLIGLIGIIQSEPDAVVMVRCENVELSP